MGANRAVIYVEPGKVDVRDIGYPDLILRDGPGVNPLNVGRKMRTWCHSKKSSQQTFAEVTSIWSGAERLHRADWYWGTKLPVR
ncbi:hypothetical protein GCM10020331_014070 [Ectobacillus funiculus]